MENFLILKWLMEELAVFIRSDRVHDLLMHDLVIGLFINRYAFGYAV